MKIDSLAVGSIGTNCYILQDEAAKLCAVIDPGDEPERILSGRGADRLHPHHDPADPRTF